MDLKDILAAQQRLLPFLRRTPMFAASQTPRDPLIENMDLHFKLEMLQATGAFKVRGALNKMLLCDKEELKKGVVTASGGNHGRAVAYAALLNQVPSQIYVPKSAPKHMVDAILAQGAQVYVEGHILDKAAEVATKYAADEGKVYIHGFKDPEVIAGAGTVGLEIFEDMSDVDTVLIATGGGGLLAGVSMAIKEQNPKVKIVGVEPVGAPTIAKCLEAGEIIRLPQLNTIAGTLALATTFPLNFEIIQRYVDEMYQVSDHEMLKAARWLWRRFGIAAEVSAAAVMAVLLTEKYKPAKGEKVCAIICGLGADGMAEGRAR